MNIILAIADSNKEYTERLAEALQQHDELIIHRYTSAQKLQEALEEKSFDIVLFDPDLAEKRLDFSKVKLPVCLYSDEARNRDLYTECAKTLKYQRISNIYKEFIREYADKAGYSADFDHSEDTAILAVYSPIGGSGKTTVALSVASKLSNMGKTVLFLDLEQLGSSFGMNPKQEDGIVSLIESISEPNVNFELKVKGLMKQGIGGMQYIEGFDRLVDYEAVTGDEITDVLNKIRRCGICNVIVADMDSGLDRISRSVLEVADHIIVVEKPGELSATKMELFMKQAFVAEKRAKMSRVCNFAENNSNYAADILFPTVGTIHNYGNLQLKNVLQAINTNNEVNLDKVFNQ